MTSRVRIILLAGMSMLVAVVVCTQIRSADPGPDHSGDVITVVPAPTVPIVSTPFPESPASPPAVAIGAMDTLSRPERAVMFKGRSRDARWATQTERRLGQLVAGKLAGLSLDAVTCTDVLCEVKGTIDARAIANQQTMIDALMDGSELGRAYIQSGVEKNGSVTIDADDARNLHFTQYLKKI